MSTPGGAGGNAVVNIILEESGVVEGVITADGAPLVGHGVMALTMPEAIAPGERFTGPLASASAETDDEGKFRFADLPAGNVQITCNWERRNRHINVEVVPGETATAAIDFPTGSATLEGHIRQEEGVASESATLSLMLSSPLGDESFHVESDPEGNYQLDALPAGSYEVLVRIGEGIPVKFAASLEIEDGAAVVRDFNPAEGTPIGTPTEAVQVIVPLIR